MKRYRYETPSGLLYILKEDDIKYILECIIESPPEYSSTIHNLSRRSGIKEDNIHNHLTKLENLDIIELNNNEYTINDDSIIVKELHGLNSAVNVRRD